MLGPTNGKFNEADSDGGRAARLKPWLDRFGGLPRGLFLALAVLVTVNEARALQGRRWAERAQNLARTADSEATLAAAARALRWEPTNPQARLIQAVKLKEAGRWEELSRAMPPLLAAHPNQAHVRRLAGEAAFRREDFAAAADFLTQALWINPTPPTSPAGFWRMAMRALLLAGEPERALGAAVRALALLPEDNYLTPAEQRDLRLDAAYVFDVQGFSLVAGHLRAAARLGPAGGGQPDR